MTVIADGRPRNLIVAQELASPARILTGDEISFFEHPKGTQGDVFEVAYRRRNYVKRPRHFWSRDDWRPFPRRFASRWSDATCGTITIGSPMIMSLYRPQCRVNKAFRAQN